MGINVILGSGLNIKRSQLCGRNFEYFSEDPYHAGKGSAMLDVLTGEVCPSGKLNETYPISYEDTPAYNYFPSKERSTYRDF